MKKRRLMASVLSAVLIFCNGSICSFADSQSNPKQGNNCYPVKECVAEAESAAYGGVEINTGRHYNVKEEVERDTITNEWLYPDGENERTALKKVYCKSCIHYRVYRMRVGDPDYKVFLYDEYKTTWKGYVRSKTSDPWTLKWDYTNQITRDRSPVVELMGSGSR